MENLVAAIARYARAFVLASITWSRLAQKPDAVVALLRDDLGVARHRLAVIARQDQRG